MHYGYGDIAEAAAYAGAGNLCKIKKHPALDHVSQINNWKFGKRIVFCEGNVENEEGIQYLPWYMISYYQPAKAPLGYLYQIDLSAL